MSKLLMISSDCHAGALPAMYKDYMPRKLHEANDDWWLGFAREMMERAGTFFDQEAVSDFSDQVGDEGTGRMKAGTADFKNLSDDAVRAMLTDEESPFAPRRGEFDADARLKELEDDGIAGEVIFPQMAPFGAGLMQYRNPVDADLNLEGNRAYNRWLADFCNAHPGRHAGVALVNVEDIDVTCQEIRNAKEAGLWGGVLLPSGTGSHPYYHHPRYEPIWSTCVELDMPVHTHSGWSPDYGDVPAATAMFISEVDMWAHRVFTGMLWGGAFERHPKLKLVLTEQGCSWILEALRMLEHKASNPLFAHFKKDLSLSPTEYFQRNCFMGASFLTKAEAADRAKIGEGKLMWGSDYPHIEGTWPNTMDSLRETFGTMPEDEVRAMLAGNALEVFDFDAPLLSEVAQRIGPDFSQITA